MKKLKLAFSSKEGLSAESIRKMSILFNHFMVFCELFFLIFFILAGFYKIIWVVCLNMTLTAIGYYWLKKSQMQKWVTSVYFICLDIMTAGTAGVGFGYGFYLYTLSMITVAFYIYYVGQKYYKEQPTLDPKLTTILCIISYYFSYIFIKVHGPIYDKGETAETIFFVFNSIVVIVILTVYMSIFVRTIIKTEKELEEMALIDKLTGLYNRHYILSYIEKINKENLNDYWIAILDIDNFKKVNDVYGHNCGDYVLQNVAQTAKNTCSDCTVCRWGGEEFIILAPDDKCENDILEKLREAIAGLHMNYENQDIKVTVTIGTEDYSENYGVDEWISYADQKLYLGKHSGKNKVVY